MNVHVWMIVSAERKAVVVMGEEYCVRTTDHMKGGVGLLGWSTSLWKLERGDMNECLAMLPYPLGTGEMTGLSLSVPQLCMADG